MKKFMLLVLAALLVLSIKTSAMAFGFSSTGIVDPYYGPTTATSGTARYYFYIDSDIPGLTVDTLALRFEGDIFDLNAMPVGNFSMINPSGWTNEIDTYESGMVWTFNTGTGITTAQDPIVLQVNYVLQDANRVLAASGTGWEWNEGQVWAQTYALSGPAVLGLRGTASGGGSTAPVPEPATMAMLGMGVLGLFGLKRKA